MECRLAPEDMEPFDSLYVGGGTPSCLPDPDLERLVHLIRDHFLFSEDTECTLEANPDDLAPQRLRLFRELGFNRLSVGVQSLNDEELRFLGRRHTALQAQKALGWAREADFQNLGVDLMYGLPGQDLPRWTLTLEKALSFSPEHVSCYQLTIAERTPFGRMRKEGRMAELDREMEEKFFLGTSSFLEERRYLHYEVSNYALGTKVRCRHNLKYWTHAPYLGLGPSAHSHLRGHRWWNIRDLSSYCLALEEGESPVAERETLTPEQIRLEKLMLGFRTRIGLPVALLCPGGRFTPALQELEDEGLLEIREEKVLPTTRGLLVADSLPLLFSESRG